MTTGPNYEFAAFIQNHAIVAASPPGGHTCSQSCHTGSRHNDK